MPRVTVAEREFLTGLPRRVVVHARKLKDDHRRLRHLCEFVRPHLSVFARPVVPIVVDLIDRSLTGVASDAHLTRARGLLAAFDWSQESLPAGSLGADLFAAVHALAYGPTQHVEARFPLLLNVERQAALLRDIHGNPYRPVGFDARWRTSSAIGLAATMYESRDFAALPILADALEEAGCDAADLLAHCRDPGLTHVRGCWAVDLVLGKG